MCKKTKHVQNTSSILLKVKLLNMLLVFWKLGHIKHDSKFVYIYNFLHKFLVNKYNSHNLIEINKINKCL